MHAHQDDLGLYVRGRLEDAQFSKIESHLKDCVSCAAKLTEEAKFFVQFKTLGREPRTSGGRDDKRREHRITTDTPAEVRMFSPFCAERFPARILDVSKNGLKLGFDRRLPLGSVVQVHVKPLYILGEVRYCVASASGEIAFLVGLQVQDVQGW